MTLSFPLPQKCSLIQAALWMTRGQQPIPDELFNAAPLALGPTELEPHGRLRLLVQALRSGQLPAWADFIFYTALEDDGNPLVPTGAGNMLGKLPAKCWQWRLVNWQKSEIVGLDFGFFDYANLASRQPKNEEMENFILTSREIIRTYKQGKLLISGIQVDSEKLLSLFEESPHSKQEVPKSPTEGAKNTSHVGRPNEYDWGAMYIEAAAWIYENGIPQTQQELISVIMDRCGELWGKDRIPANSTLKAKIRPLWERLTQTRGVTDLS